jgi:isoleucyl-tRNA synthetase
MWQRSSNKKGRRLVYEVCLGAAARRHHVQEVREKDFTKEMDILDVWFDWA